MVEVEYVEMDVGERRGEEAGKGAWLLQNRKHQKKAQRKKV